MDECLGPKRGVETHADSGEGDVSVRVVVVRRVVVIGVQYDDIGYARLRV